MSGEWECSIDLIGPAMKTSCWFVPLLTTGNCLLSGLAMVAVQDRPGTYERIGFIESYRGGRDIITACKTGRPGTELTII